MRDSSPPSVLSSLLALAIALATASCTAPGKASPAAAGNVSLEGSVVSIDTQPWTYDGHAVVELAVAGRGRVAVQLPARWNLCQAAPVDVQALAVGVRVQAVGAAEGTDRLTVCSDPAHRLVPLESAEDVRRVGAGSAITLAPLSAQDIEAAALGGELGCSFSARPGQPPLLMAMGDVASKEPARGVVKVAGHVEAVATPGGFDAMLRGARFAGAGRMVDIHVTGPATGGGESPAHPATLTYDRADGAQRQWSGWWQCGP